MAILLTIVAGALLASMIYLNGSLATYSDPVWASFITHLVGTIAALGMLMLLRQSKNEENTSRFGLMRIGILRWAGDFGQ
ncbi:MAG: DMT family transporter [Bdellovibrionota bacterium]